MLLVRLDDRRHHLIWTSHHLLLDGWSSARLIAEVLERYTTGQPLPPVTGRYRDYIAWLASQDRAAGEAFWRQELQDLEGPTLAGPGGRPPCCWHAGHGRQRLVFDRAASEALQGFARRERITLNTLVQGAWSLLLARYTGQRAVAFGVTVAGRPAGLPGAESLLGLFINTLPFAQRSTPAPPGRRVAARPAGGQRPPARARAHAPLRHPALGGAGGPAPVRQHPRVRELPGRARHRGGGRRPPLRAGWPAWRPPTTPSRWA